MKNIRKFYMISFVFLLTRCGVEVGNPVDTRPKTGMIQIQFAKVSDTFGESFKLNISDLSLSTGTSDSESEVVEDLNLSSNEVELFGLTEDASEVDVGTSTVAVGSYDVITIGFDQEKPLSFQGTGEQPANIPFNQEGLGEIRLSQSVEVIEGETTTIILDLDPRNSLVRGDQGGFKFDPMLRGHKKGLNHTFEGTTDMAGAVRVCAYLYDVVLPPKKLLPPRPSRAFGERKPPKGRVGKDGRRPKVFEAASDVIKDEVLRCPNAFQRVRVIEGKYKFLHLIPGTYDFRIFAEDGSFKDEIVGEKIEPVHGLRGKRLDEFQ